jgi:hypothetical protein
MINVDVRIKFTSHYKLAISISHKFLLDNLKRYFETKDMIVFRTRGKRPVLRRELKVSDLWQEYDDNTILVDAGLIDYTVAWFRLIDKSEFKISLDITIPSVNAVIINDKWNQILRDDQKEDIVALTSHYGGLAAQHTGYGKTMCLLAILESIEGRSVVLVPTSGIMSEVLERAKTFDVSISHYKWGENTEIINPKGFLRSNEAKKDIAKEWLSEVKNVFTDEAHYLQANSWNEMFNLFLPDARRSYGFSASPDSKNGKHLSPTDMIIKELGFKSAKIVGLSGTTRVRRRAKAKMTLVEVKTEITPENHRVYENWQEALCDMMERPECARIIATVMSKYSNITFYIPVHSIQSGKILFKNLERYGAKGVFWRAGETIPNFKPDEDPLACVKRYIVKDEYRFLMTTSVAYEGVDMPVLSGIIPLIGQSYRTVMQPLGRATRGDTVMYVLIRDKNNNTMEKQTKERKSKISREYDIVQRIKLSL